VQRIFADADADSGHDVVVFEAVANAHAGLKCGAHAGSRIVIGCKIDFGALRGSRRTAVTVAQPAARIALRANSLQDGAAVARLDGTGAK